MRPSWTAEFSFTGAAFLLLAACATTPEQRAPTAFSFAVMGDIPYGPEDDAVLQNEILPRIKAADYPFVLHVGDYKSGGAPCTQELDEAFATLVASLAPKPVFYTPGDNEWTDCDRNLDPATGKPMSELGRLDYLRRQFFADAPAALKAMRARQQKSQPENLTWRHGGVRFASLSIVGTNNGRSYVAGDPLDAAKAATEARDAANIDWLHDVTRLAKKERASALVVAMQADATFVEHGPVGKPCDSVAAAPNPCDAFVALRAAIHDAAIAFGGPVLVIHGDTEPFTVNQEFLESAAPNLWRLNAAGDVHFHDGGWHGVRDATLVTIAPGASPPFSAKALVSGAAPTSE
jgi:hypothetical protein